MNTQLLCLFTTKEELDKLNNDIDNYFPRDKYNENNKKLIELYKV